MKELELLSPARDLELGKAAINYGADAVYIGGPQFGARAAVGNSVRDIEDLCSYARFYRAKVFVALNTILYDSELKKAEELIHAVWNAGADALIIQDLGILQMHLPPIPLHASTQTHNYELERIQFLESAGFERIILARELAVAEIQHIRAHTRVELESFVHGALCVSLSGQCYASQFTTGRSANRGECSQFCRQPFDLVDSEGKLVLKNRHFLSLRDFNASQQVKNLVEAGISSFKIEGRLKDKAYLINNTAHYRQVLDLILEEKTEYRKASSGKTIFSFIPDPEKTFNRGYSQYFLEQRTTEMAFFESPKAKGKRIGEVVEVKGNRVLIRALDEVHTGDGLCFISSGGLEGFLVNGTEPAKKTTTPNPQPPTHNPKPTTSTQQPAPSNPQLTWISPSKAISFRIGDPIYRNFDRLFLKELEANRDVRRVALDFIFSELPDGFELYARDEDGHEVRKKLVAEKEEARKADGVVEGIEKQLSKAGYSAINQGRLGFGIRDIKLNLSKPWFIRTALLNELRRETIQELENRRIKNKAKEKDSQIPNPESRVPNPESRIPNPESRIPNPLLFPSNISNHKSREFHALRGAQVIQPAFELLPPKETHDQVLMTTRYCLKYELGVCPHKQDPSKSPVKWESGFALSDRNRQYPLEFDCKSCLMKVRSPRMKG